MGRNSRLHLVFLCHADLRSHRALLHDEKDHEIAKTNEELAKVAKHGDDPGQLAEALPVLGEAACQKGIAVTKMMP